MIKFIIVSLSLLSSFLCSTYMPMTKRTINFGDNVCHYKDINHNSNIEYVKPCEEGKKCVQHSDTSNEYDIYTCEDYVSVYENKEQVCYDNIECASYSCNNVDTNTDNKKCGASIPSCSESQVIKQNLNDGSEVCVGDPNYCSLRDDNGAFTELYLTTGPHKECVEIELKQYSGQKNFFKKKVYSNYIASIEDGKYIEDGYEEYCQSGYALYFYGDGSLKKIDTNSNYDEMYLRCVTVEGIDSNNVIKYSIGNDIKYYNTNELTNKVKPLYDTNGNIIGTISYQVYNNIDYLKTKLEMFKNMKEKMDSLNCRETGCEDDEVYKWKYFYYNPQEYLLYQNEPQVMEYLIQTSFSQYKAEHTSPTESSSLLNVKYLTALLSLLLLF